jgi:hypothetical protein
MPDGCDKPTTSHAGITEGATFNIRMTRLRGYVYGGQARNTRKKNALREDRYERCLHGKPPQVAEYSRGLSRASTRVSRIDSG